jgi:cytochrome c peroxidase
VAKTDALGLVIALTALSSCAAGAPSPSDLMLFPNASGLQATWIGSGSVDLITKPFFQPLASSGRSCGSCHQPAQGWTISAAEVKARFEATKGLDPIFRTNDGSNCNHNIDTSTLDGRRVAYRLLIDKALIRIALRVPAAAEFEVAGVANPYGCSDRSVLSMYRRPLPTTNLRFLTSLMWDGRGSSPQTGTQTITAATNPKDLLADLTYQTLDAVRRHAQASATLTVRQQQAIVSFEMGLVTAQAFDHQAGALDALGGKGGPTLVATQTASTFVVGINDPKAGDPHAIKPEDAFRLFDAWSPLPYGRVYNEVHRTGDTSKDRRASIARGQVLFDQKPFDIKGVAGFNDVLNLPSVTGACGTCHNSPNAGNHSVADAMNTGVADVNSPLDVTYLPVITLRNRSTGELRVTTDPGRALITGLWEDIGKVKAPVLRGLAGRPPYFHNGSANSLADVVNFYEKRFHAGFSAQDKDDLVAFLSAL